jgi:hypothetical protein
MEHCSLDCLLSRMKVLLLVGLGALAVSATPSGCGGDREQVNLYTPTILL